MPVEGGSSIFPGTLGRAAPRGHPRAIWAARSGQRCLPGWSAGLSTRDSLEGQEIPWGALNFQLHSVIPRLLKEAPWEGLPLPSMVKDGLQGICVQNDVRGTNRIQ